jgi:hypothetical protein
VVFERTKEKKEKASRACDLFSTEEEEASISVESENTVIISDGIKVSKSSTHRQVFKKIF